MDTQGVRLFVLAAELLNISTVGRTLGLVPSVASAKLAKLELELAVDLFHRATRKVALSLEGQAFDQSPTTTGACITNPFCWF